MSIEHKLTEALREEAEARDVEVTRLWVETQARLAQQPTRRSRRVPLVAAAAALVVTAGVAGLAQLDGSGDSDPARQITPERDAVDDEFTCPEQITHDWTRPDSVTDEYFVASLHGGPERQAAGYGAARYEFDESGDRAFLRFGNTDGTLATLSEFRRDDHGEWASYRTDVCVGRNGSVAVPVNGDLDLGPHGNDDPYSFEDTVYGERKGYAVLVDDRSYYDHVGLVRHRSLYALNCGRRVCLTSAEEQGGSGTILRPGVVPQDVSHLFLPTDEVPERKNPYGLWAVYDVDGVVADVTAHLRGGGEIPAQSFYASPWPGQLHMLLAPFDRVERITVHRRPGSSPGVPQVESFAPKDLPLFGPDTRR